MKRLDISDQTAISMPMKNLIAIVSAVALGVWAYFGVIERLNKLETQTVLIEKDVTAEDERLHNEVKQNTEFRIKYPRGELGQSSGEAELFMLVEHIAGLLDELEIEVKSMRNNAVNIEFLQERTKKLTEDVEKLIRNGSGH